MSTLGDDRIWRALGISSAHAPPASNCPDQAVSLMHVSETLVGRFARRRTLANRALRAAMHTGKLPCRKRRVSPTPELRNQWLAGTTAPPRQAERDRHVAVVRQGVKPLRQFTKQIAHDGLPATDSRKIPVVVTILCAVDYEVLVAARILRPLHAASVGLQIFERFFADS